MKRTSVLIAALAIIAIALGSALAAVLVTKYVGLNMRIKGTATMGVFDTDGSTVMTALGLGDFYWYEIDLFPGKLNESEYSVPTAGYWVKNLDQTNMTITFSMTNVPANVRFYVAAWREDEAPSNNFKEIYESPYAFSFVLTSPSLDPTHPQAHACQFILRVWVYEGAIFGSYSPILQIDAMEVV